MRPRRSGSPSVTPETPLTSRASFRSTRGASKSPGFDEIPLNGDVDHAVPSASRSLRANSHSRTNGDTSATPTSSVRRSLRSPKLNFPSFDSDLMADHNVVRGVRGSKKRSPDKQTAEESPEKENDDKNAPVVNGTNGVTSEGSSEDEDYVPVPEEPSSHRRSSLRRSRRDSSPFLVHNQESRTRRGRSAEYHVRYSPSTKTGSPRNSTNSSSTSGLRKSLRHSALEAVEAEAKRQRVVKNLRLHNVPSEDEQSEFYRRHSRDLRRKKMTRQSMGGSSAGGSEAAAEAVQSPEDRPLRKSTRTRHAVSTTRAYHDGTTSEDGETEGKTEEEKEVDDGAVLESPMEGPSRRSMRQRSVSNNAERSPVPESRSKREKVVSASPERPPATGFVRRSTRVHKPVQPFQAHPNTSEDDESASDGHEPDEEAEDDDGEEEEEEEEEQPEEESRSGRRTGLRRRIAPVERLEYTKPPSRKSSRRRQSSDEEEEEEPVRNRSRRATRGGTRENREVLSHNSERRRGSRRSYREKDTSSSSSSDDVDRRDEASFTKRKEKRMKIERSKLLPLNMDKTDAARGVYRDRRKVGSSLADVAPMEIDTSVRFDAIGGLDEHLNTLKEMCMFPLLYPEVFGKFKMTPPKGVLFYGPPGTGKTLMARALASECSQENRKVAFFMRKGADCLSKWIGESERQLRLLFDEAYRQRPSVIFFDEIDGIAPVRSARQEQIHASIVSTLLALMDGLDDRGEIIVIGATNRIENIDPALRRPGRFDRELRFALPTQPARKEILTKHLGKWDPPVEPAMVELLSHKTIGYSGADLKGLCAEAMLNALRRRYPQVYKTSKKLALDLQQILVGEVDFFKAMKTMIPSTHRIQDQSQVPLSPEIRPLLSSTAEALATRIKKMMFSDHPYCPRLLVTGTRGQGMTTYLGPALLHAFENVPCHNLDINALYSNSARTPEEALFHAIHEAKRTVPSILYIPHLAALWNDVMTPSVQAAFLSMVRDIPPTSPLLVLAMMERDSEDVDIDQHDHLVGLGKIFETESVHEMVNPTLAERTEFFRPVFEAAVKPPVALEASATTEDQLDEQSLETLPEVPLADCRRLTEKEEKRLRRKEDAKLRELRIFLRDIWQKINREQKFFMFRTAVDTEEVYDYLEVIETPMDFDMMLSKLDKSEYSSAQDFLEDIDLICDNAIKYNSDVNYETNKIICHRAHGLRDFAYALVKAEMDTDFEDECKEIVSRREKVTEQLKEQDKAAKALEKALAQRAAASATPSTSNAEPKKTVRKTPKRRSAWSMGNISKPRKVSRRLNESSEKVGLPNGNGVLSEAEEGAHDDGAIDLDDEVDAAGEEDESPDNTNESAVPPSDTFTIDRAGLDRLQSDLLTNTEGHTLVVLQKLNCKLWEVVTKYKQELDRTQLVPDMSNVCQDIIAISTSSPPTSPNSSINKKRKLTAKH